MQNVQFNMLDLQGVQSAELTIDHSIIGMCVLMELGCSLRVLVAHTGAWVEVFSNDRAMLHIHTSSTGDKLRMEKSLMLKR